MEAAEVEVKTIGVDALEGQVLLLNIDRSATVEEVLEILISGHPSLRNPGATYLLGFDLSNPFTFSTRKLEDCFFSALQSSHKDAYSYDAKIRLVLAEKSTFDPSGRAIMRSEPSAPSISPSIANSSNAVLRRLAMKSKSMVDARPSGATFLATAPPVEKLASPSPATSPSVPVLPSSDLVSATSESAVPSSSFSSPSVDVLNGNRPEAVLISELAVAAAPPGDPSVPTSTASKKPKEGRRHGREHRHRQHQHRSASNDATSKDRAVDSASHPSSESSERGLSEREGHARVQSADILKSRTDDDLAPVAGRSSSSSSLSLSTPMAPTSSTDLADGKQLRRGDSIRNTISFMSPRAMGIGSELTIDVPPRTKTTPLWKLKAQAELNRGLGKDLESSEKAASELNIEEVGAVESKQRALFEAKFDSRKIQIKLKLQRRERTCPPCLLCRVPILPGERFIAHEDTKVHALCFCCVHCSKPLEGVPYVNADGNFWDVPHWAELQSAPISAQQSQISVARQRLAKTRAAALHSYQTRLKSEQQQLENLEKEKILKEIQNEVKDEIETIAQAKLTRFRSIVGYEPKDNRAGMQENLKLVLVAVDKSDVPELFSPKPRIKGESSESSSDSESDDIKPEPLADGSDGASPVLPARADNAQAVQQVRSQANFNAISLTDMLRVGSTLSGADTEAYQGIEPRLSGNMIGLNKRASVSMRAQFLMTEVVEEQQIIVGTSVDAMINEVTGRQVPSGELLRNFLYTYPYLIKSTALLKKLDERWLYDAPIDASAKLKLEYQRWRFTIRYRILGLIKRWLSDHPYYFLSKKLQATMTQFLRLRVKPFSGEWFEDLFALFKVTTAPKLLSPDVNLAKKKSFSGDRKLGPKKTAPSGRLAIGPRAVSESSAMSSGPGAELHSSLEEFLSFNPKKFAKQLVLHEHEMIAAIQPDEVLGARWKKADKAVRAPHVTRMIEWFNTMTGWVTSMIVASEDLKTRATVLSRFLEIAQYCEKYHCYNALMEILGAFNSSPVRRLRLTWELVSKKELKFLETLRELMNHENNFITYRTHLQSLNDEAVVPFIGLVVQDLFNMNELPNKLSGSKLVNFRKLTMMGNAIHKFRSTYQSIDFKFKPDHDIQYFLENAFCVLSEADRMSFSKKAEVGPASRASIRAGLGARARPTAAEVVSAIQPKVVEQPGESSDDRSEDKEGSTAGPKQTL